MLSNKKYFEPKWIPFYESLHQNTNGLKSNTMLPSQSLDSDRIKPFIQ